MRGRRSLRCNGPTSPCSVRGNSGGPRGGTLLCCHRGAPGPTAGLVPGPTAGLAPGPTAELAPRDTPGHFPPRPSTSRRTNPPINCPGKRRLPPLHPRSARPNARGGSAVRTAAAARAASAHRTSCAWEVHAHPPRPLCRATWPSTRSWRTPLPSRTSRESGSKCSASRPARSTCGASRSAAGSKRALQWTIPSWPNRDSSSRLPAWRA